MSSADVIDALFVKTVDMVQSLPKSGPIQTSYEEKLALYSLYKQATEGDVRSKRPGMLDMLGRAKWDAWAKVRGLSSRDAKQMYVESMLRILRRFNDRPQAVSLIEELESFSGQVAQRVMDGSLANVVSEEESYTDDDESDPQIHTGPTSLNHPISGASSVRPERFLQLKPSSITGTSTAATQGGETLTAHSAGRTPAVSDSEDEISDDDHVGGTARSFRSRAQEQTSLDYGSQSASRSQPRPGSVVEQDVYQGSLVPRSHAASPPPQNASAVLHTRGFQPMQASSSRPFAGIQSAAHSFAGSAYPRHREPQQYQRSTYATSSVGGRSVRTAGGPPAHSFPHRPSSNAGTGPSPRPEMELALQSIQASLAALHERLNRVEDRSLSNSSNDARRSHLPVTSSLGRRLYLAMMDIVADVRQLLGLTTVIRSPRSEALAPSFLAEGGKGKRQANATVGLLGSPMKIVMALVNLCARLTLDLVSLVLVSSIFLYAFKSVTGRGDPLLMLRILRRFQQAILRRPRTTRQVA